MAGIQNLQEAKKVIDYYEYMLRKLATTVADLSAWILKVRETLDQLADIEFSTVEVEKLKIPKKKLNKENILQTLEWLFDWVSFIDSNWAKYPVPMNYASKSKLVPWDKLKLRIMKNWDFVFKLIEKAPRQKITAILSKDKEGKRIAIYKNKYVFLLNHASVSYYKWKPWDKILIIVNKSKPWKYAVLDAVLSQ